MASDPSLITPQDYLNFFEQLDADAHGVIQTITSPAIDSNRVLGARQIHEAFHQELRQVKSLLATNPREAKESLRKAATFWNDYVQIHQQSRKDLGKYLLKDAGATGAGGVGGYLAFGTVTGGLGIAALGFLGFTGFIFTGKNFPSNSFHFLPIDSLERGMYYSFSSPQQAKPIFWHLLEQKQVHEAQSALIHKDQPFNFVRFFIREGIIEKFTGSGSTPESETLQSMESNFFLDETRWRTITAGHYTQMEAVRNATSQQKIEKFSQLMRSDLPDYDPNQENFAWALEGKRKNCAVGTLWALGVALEVLDLGPHWKVGAHPLPAHVDPIAYNPQTNEAYNLITGEKIDPEIIKEYPLFDYREMLISWLEAKEIKPARTRDEFLLSPATRMQSFRYRHFKPNLPNPFRPEDYKLSKSNNFNRSDLGTVKFADPYQTGSSPQRAYGFTQGNGISKKGLLGGQLKSREGGIEVLLPNDIQDPNTRQEVENKMKESKLPFLSKLINGKRVFIFEKESDRDQYLALDPSEEPLEPFFSHLFAEREAEILGDPRVTRVIHRALNTEWNKIGNQLTANELRLLSKVGFQVTQFESELRDLRKNFLDKFDLSKPSIESPFTSPLREKLQELDKVFTEAPTRNPSSYLLYIDSLPFEKKMILLQESVMSLKQVIELATDPHQVLIRPTPKKVSYPESIKPGESNENTSPHYSDSKSPKFLIHTDTFIALSLIAHRFQPVLLNSRNALNYLEHTWNDAMSRELLELNRMGNGKWDKEIVETYVVLSNKKGKELKINPLTKEQMRKIYSDALFIKEVSPDIYEILLDIKKRHFG